jgi:hypothetical protein
MVTTTAPEVERVLGSDDESRSELLYRASRVLIIHTDRLCDHSKNDEVPLRAEAEARWELDPTAVHATRLVPDAVAGPEPQVDGAVDELVEVYGVVILRRALGEDEPVVVLGEGIADPYAGAFKVTHGLSTTLSVVA